MRPFRRHDQSSADAGTAADGDVIDLRVPHISGKELLEWGMPGRCPECGGYGYLDRIDLVDEVMHQHCPSCWHHWKVSKREIEVSAARAAELDSA
jgi:hypothetical protein